MIMKLVLQECLGTVDLRRAADGEQAMFLLKQFGMSIDYPLPDLVLLDVNIPGLSGFDLLEFIKSQDLTRNIPVVMFTSSRDTREERKALALGAKEFITKPSNLDGMLATLNQVCSKYLAERRSAVA